jgi:CubicO group peptidase (beta-lactamase class C family)
MMRFLKRVALGVLGLIVLAILGAFIAQPTVTSRLVGLAFGGDQGPREIARGGNVPALVVAGDVERRLSTEVLDQVVAFGTDNESHALLIWQGGALQLEHYYPGHSATSVTPTQSMHKSVLALLIGIAIEQGLIKSVDEPAATYLPEWAGDERAKITIRQMLQQASGIDFPGFWGLVYMTLGGNVQPFTLQRGTVDEPGARFEYNNINPQALGILLQRVSGRTYTEFLEENFWRHVAGEDAAVLIDSKKHGIPITFCCLDSPARAWLRVGLLHLNGGWVGDRQVVPARWMEEVVTPSPANPNYGYFTWLGTSWEPVRRYNSKSVATVAHSEAFAAPDVIYFDGFGGQRVYVVPSKQLVIVHTGPIRQDWDDAALPNLVIRALP